MIIWGSRVREKETGSGQFHCPRCNTQQTYKRKRVARYFTLYFIPIVETQYLGEYVECQSCRFQFKPDVLRYKPPSPNEKLFATARAELETGTPAHIVQRKLTNAGLDEETAKGLVFSAAGLALKTCPQCGFEYHPQVNTCSNCGATFAA